MELVVLRKYVPPTGGADAPGEHYTLKNLRAETHIAGQPCHRHYRFYRTKRGREVAADTGFDAESRYYWPIADDSPVFAAIKAAVEAWEAKQRSST